MGFSTKSILVICLIIVGIFATVALIYGLGVFTQPRVELSVEDKNWKDQPIKIILRFESDDGLFTTGNVVHVHALIIHQSTIIPHKTVALYFPNTLTVDQYDKLKDDTQWTTVGGGAVTGVFMPNGLGQTPWTLSGNFPTSKFDIIWTQEGPQDGYLIIQDPSNGTTINSEPNLDGAVNMTKIINIEPADVLQNLRTTNIIAGLTLVIIALTLVTIIVKYKPEKNS